MHVNVCMHGCMQVSVYTYMHISVYIHTQRDTHIHVHMCIEGAVWGMNSTSLLQNGRLQFAKAWSPMSISQAPPGKLVASGAISWGLES